MTGGRLRTCPAAGRLGNCREIAAWSRGHVLACSVVDTAVRYCQFSLRLQRAFGRLAGHVDATAGRLPGVALAVVFIFGFFSRAYRYVFTAEATASRPGGPGSESKHQEKQREGKTCR